MSGALYVVFSISNWFIKLTHFQINFHWKTTTNRNHQQSASTCWNLKILCPFQGCKKWNYRRKLKWVTRHDTSGAFLLALPRKILRWQVYISLVSFLVEVFLLWGFLPHRRFYYSKQIFLNYKTFSNFSSLLQTTLNLISLWYF